MTPIEEKNSPCNLSKVLSACLNSVLKQQAQLVGNCVGMDFWKDRNPNEDTATHTKEK